MRKVLIALCFLGLIAQAQVTPSVVERNAAASWANEYRQDVFEAVMPSAAGDSVQMPECRVTTLRVSGSLDTREYAIRLVELCPQVNERGGLTEGGVTGELLVAAESPIADQLARLRLSEPAVTSESAIKRIRIRRVQLTTSEASRVLGVLSDVTLPPLPSTDIALDAPTYELASATGMMRRVVDVTPAGRSRGERCLIKLAATVAATKGFDEKGLRYDASFWN